MKPLIQWTRNGLTLAGLLGVTWWISRKVQRQIQLTLQTHTLRIHARIRVLTPASEVYRFLSHFESYPRFMSYVEDVGVNTTGSLIWQIRGPASIPLSLETQIIELTPERAIAWETSPDAALRLRGRFSFNEVHSGETELAAELVFSSPGGMWGEQVLGTLGFSPQAAFSRDLSRLRDLIEAEYAQSQQKWMPISSSQSAA